MIRRVVFAWACLSLLEPAQAVDAVPDGRALYDKHCAGCHAVDANRVGPAHRGVFGRKAGLARNHALRVGQPGVQGLRTQK